MNSRQIDARRAPATLEKQDGKEVLVRSSMVSFVLEACDALDATLAQIPATLTQNGLESYDNEKLQREVIKDGGGSVWLAVFNRTLKSLESTGLVPKLSRQYANKNADEAVPHELQQRFDNIAAEISALCKELAEANGDNPDLDRLWFKSGKLRVPPAYREAVAPRFTMEVPSKDRKLVKAMRETAGALADLKRAGVDIAIVSRMANGSEYDDAELLGALTGIILTH